MPTSSGAPTEAVVVSTEKQRPVTPGSGSADDTASGAAGLVSTERAYTNGRCIRGSIRALSRASGSPIRTHDGAANAHWKSPAPVLATATSAVPPECSARDVDPPAAVGRQPDGDRAVRPAGDGQDVAGRESAVLRGGGQPGELGAGLRLLGRWRAGRVGLGRRAGAAAGHQERASQHAGGPPARARADRAHTAIVGLAVSEVRP